LDFENGFCFCFCEIGVERPFSGERERLLLSVLERSRELECELELFFDPDPEELEEVELLDPERLRDFSRDLERERDRELFPGALERRRNSGYREPELFLELTMKHFLPPEVVRRRRRFGDRERERFLESDLISLELECGRRFGDFERGF